MNLIEIQVDRIVGPTHHFGGLGVGNVASQKNEGSVSNPRAAALQGLDKMRLVAELGVPQFVLPPQPRPDFQFLRDLGFGGTDAEVLASAAKQSPRVLSAAMSSSAMWTANAATVSAAVDGGLRHPALTVANLSSSLHRALEPEQTLKDLQQVLPPDTTLFPAVPGGAMMRDEGAANHLRLGARQSSPGIHVFVYGDQSPNPKSHWPRQSLAACQAIARRHQLPAENTFFLKQHPQAIDAGAFHNDVVAASHHGLLLHHEMAFHDADAALESMSRRYRQLYNSDLVRAQVSQAELSLEDSISTYLFNSQIVSTHVDEPPTIICPSQVAQQPDAKEIVDRWCDAKRFKDAYFVNLRQSMAGGGGPACLRLRVPLKAAVIDAMPVTARWSTDLHARLSRIIHEHYPDSLGFSDLSNINFIENAIQTRQRLADQLSV